MNIYTRTGDDGETGLIDGRVDKHHIRVEAYGTIDELNSFIAAAREAMAAAADVRLDDLCADLLEIQHSLFDCGADMARQRRREHEAIHSEMTTWLEKRIDHYAQETQPLTNFVLPGGTAISAALHISRTVCRRAERISVALARREEINPEIIRYLNRLSDLLFTMARTVNARCGVADIAYIGSGQRQRSSDGNV